jgi:ADP-dependent NAD(P)H-hydrate dehydratase / NAD(P)H-hydrate epimerase
MCLCQKAKMFVFTVDKNLTHAIRQVTHFTVIYGGCSSVVEHSVVVRDVAGSIPVSRPIYFLIMAFEILNNQQMAEADSLVIESGVSGFDLMKRAGEGVADFIHIYYPGRNVLVLCGSGNNGGDGFIAAKKLQNGGHNVRLACLAPKDKLKNDALRAAQQWDGEIFPFENLTIDSGELIVDAVFGTGLVRDFIPPVKEIFEQIKNLNSDVVAVDIPSGVNGSTGESLSLTPHARHTITFCRRKIGHVLLPGREFSGTVHVVDIGIPDEVVEQVGSTATENRPHLWRSSLRRKTASCHKYDYGHAILYGGPRMTGAACMSAYAALRTGAGVCTIVANPDTADIYRHYMPNIMYEPIEALKDFDTHLADGRRNAVLMGPGAGQENRADLKRLIESVCKRRDRKIVLDADALTVFADNPEVLYRMLRNRENVVLTPHEGEFAKIFPGIQGTKIERAEQASVLTNATIVLKGFESVIAAPGRKSVVNTYSSPYLATAGSGDVLAGIIVGFIAQNVPVFESSCAAVWLHSEAARAFGPGLVATDIIELIPAIIGKLF